MKDNRVAAFRTALDSLVTSMEAAVRIARWTSADAIPDPLKKAAGLLADRLEIATKLADTKVNAPPPVMARITAMTEAVRKLEAAYAEYRTATDAAPDQSAEAALGLDQALGEIKDGSDSWS